MTSRLTLLALLAGATFGAVSGLLEGCQGPPQYDVLIQGGRVVDGTGAAPFQADVGIIGERIVAIGSLESRSGKTVIDAAGMRSYKGKDMGRGQPMRKD